MNEKDFVKMIVSNFMLIEANQLMIMVEISIINEIPPEKIAKQLAPTYKQIDNLKELMCQLNKPPSNIFKG